MKNQYFGDERDYRKFNLGIEFANALLPKPRLTYVAMRTPNDASSHGGSIDYPAGNGSPKLHSFLQHHGHLQRALRNVVNLRDYFATDGKDIEYLPYGDDHPQFDGGTRDRYFAGLPDQSLQDAIILADPDTGITPPTGKRSSCKHILPQDIAALKQRMGSSSVLVVFQWRGQGRSWQKVFDYTEDCFEQQGAGGQFDAVYRGSLALICVTKTESVCANLQPFLREYAERHDMKIASR